MEKKGRVLTKFGSCLRLRKFQIGALLASFFDFKNPTTFSLKRQPVEYVATASTSLVKKAFLYALMFIISYYESLFTKRFQHGWLLKY